MSLQDEDAALVVQPGKYRGGLLRGIQIRTAPYIGEMVHWRSYDTDGLPCGQRSVCCAAVVTEIGSKPADVSDGLVALWVLYAAGQFSARGVRYDAGVYEQLEPRTITIRLGELPGPLPLITCADLTFAPGTWHFIPEAS